MIAEIVNPVPAPLLTLTIVEADPRVRVPVVVPEIEAVPVDVMLFVTVMLLGPIATVPPFKIKALTVPDEAAIVLKSNVPAIVHTEPLPSWPVLVVVCFTVAPLAIDTGPVVNAATLPVLPSWNVPAVTVSGPEYVLAVVPANVTTPVPVIVDVSEPPPEITPVVVSDVLLLLNVKALPVPVLMAMLLGIVNVPLD